MPTADHLIDYLRSFQKRKSMYLHPVSVLAVENFLTGFATACHAFGHPIDPELRWNTRQSRGWNRQAVGPIPQMKASGLSEEQIMDELIEIEIVTLQAHEN